MQQTALPPIKGFIDHSWNEWPGHACAVLLLPYCNLRCPYCHQHRLVLKPNEIESLALDDILNRMAGREDQIEGMCISGGEPSISRTLPGLLRKIREAGFKTAIATNGTQPEILQDLIARKLLDHVSIDVKAPLDDISYSRCAGVPVPAGLIKATIAVLMASSLPLTFQCTAVPSLLSEADIYRLAEDLKDLWGRVGATDRCLPPLVLKDFLPDNTMDENLRTQQPFGKEALSRLQRQVDEILDLGRETRGEMR